jgi:hypothetical protein
MSTCEKINLEKYQEEIVKQYESGLAVKTIADSLGISEGKLYRFLKYDKNVQIRSKPKFKDYKDRILEMYNNKVPVLEMCDKLKLCDGTIYNWLKKMGLESYNGEWHNKRFSKEDIKNIIQDYKNGLGCTSLSRKYNFSDTSITSLLVKNNIEIRPIRKYFFDEHFFDHIDSQAKSYLLGFFMADGYLSKKENYITLHITDLEPIEYLAKCVNYPIENINMKTFPKTSNNKTQYFISLCSKHMAVSMLNNIKTKDKTHHLKFPGLDILPREHQAGFLRGFLDGDGSITIKEKNGSKCLVVTYIGTIDMIEGIKKIIDEDLGVYSKINYKPAKTSFPMARIMLCGQKNALPFLDYIYKDHEFCLERKYRRYKEMKDYYQERNRIRKEKRAANDSSNF